jgi:hypothetical protein
MCAFTSTDRNTHTHAHTHTRTVLCRIYTSRIGQPRLGLYQGRHGECALMCLCACAYACVYACVHVCVRAEIGLHQGGQGKRALMCLYECEYACVYASMHALAFTMIICNSIFLQPSAEIMGSIARQASRSFYDLEPVHISQLVWSFFYVLCLQLCIVKKDVC